MEKDNPGFNELHKLGNGEFVERKSFTCVTEFTPSFPKKKSTEFKLDPQFPQHKAKSNPYGKTVRGVYTN